MIIQLITKGKLSQFRSANKDGIYFLKAARLDFLGSILPQFERLLRRHHQNAAFA